MKLSYLSEWVLGLAVLGVAVVAIVNGGRATRSEARVAALEHSIDSLEAVGARLDTVYVVKRDTVWRRITAVDTMTLTVQEWKHDTTKVVEYVTKADSAIQGCKALVLDCEARVANRDERIVKLDSLRVEDKKVARQKTVKVVGLALVAWEGVKFLLRPK